MSTNPPIRIGFIGAGIFAQEAHWPALQALGDRFQLTAVYSRRLENAQALAEQADPPAFATDDMDVLLARDDVDAVSILLPIDLLPGAVERALAAGKHVISEKPVAPDVATGRRLIERYQHDFSDRVWMVAENWRYEPSMVRAAEVVRSGEIGRPLMFHWIFYVDMTPANKYYHTAWRRAGDFPGGFILDAGVHHMAVIRLVLGEIVEVSAMSALMREDLPPTDTLIGALRLESGLLGAYGVTFAQQGAWENPLYIVGERGSIRMEVGELEISVGGASRLERPGREGVEREFAAFAAAIQEGAPHVNSPQQALQDVAVIEALLRAAQTGQREAVERVV